jgi:predicted ester cyclase
MHNRPREVATRWFDEVWNKGRREAIAEMLLPDAILHEGGKDSRGPEGFYPFFDRLQAACSDIRVKIGQTIVENDLVCVRWLVTMKHTGHGLGIAPTGKTIEATGISIVRVAGDKLAEGWQNWDMLGLMQQIQATEGADALYV